MLISIALEEHKLELIKLKKKRRKGKRPIDLYYVQWLSTSNVTMCFSELQTQRKRRKLMSGESITTGQLEKQEEGEGDGKNMEQPEAKLGWHTELQQELGDDENPTDVPEDQGDYVQPTTELSELFECELTAAKERLNQSEAGSSWTGRDDVKLKPSFGHRAGFDAFMTGYSFASIAVSLCKASRGERERDKVLDGLSEMKNKLANRGKPFPLHILKSHFTNTSQQHKTAQGNINKYFKKHSPSHHEI